MQALRFFFQNLAAAIVARLSHWIIAPFQRQIGNILGQALPVLFIMLAALGAFVTAVDMTAVEKDRATMQTLLCAPIRSLELVSGKFLAVWTVSLLSGAANIVGLGFL